MSDIFTSEEKAAFDFTEAMSHTPVDVTEDIFNNLRVYFSETQIVELAATIAMENYRARFNRAFLIEAQGLYKSKT